MTEENQAITVDAETTTELCHSGLLENLRALDREKNLLQDKQSVMISAYCFGKGWNLDTNNIDFNIQSGIITITPK